MWRDGAPRSVEVPPGLAENGAPGSVGVAGSTEDARPNQTLNSVAVSVGDLLSTGCR